MGLADASIIHHVVIVLLLLWLLSSFNCCHSVAYFVSLIYLYLIHERYVTRLRRRLQFEETSKSNQRKVLSDSETVRWLNYAVEKIWPVCMENIVSQKLLLPLIPWFLQKYKPWTVKEAVVQHLYMGRRPPMFTEMRVLRQSSSDDHLVLELGMNFRTADDMSAILAVKLRKRLGFGMRAKLHLMSMHVEGKVLLGVKFLRGWPFLGRLRLCFVEPPYFQMTVKPIFSHSLDVTELPGIAGWLDKLLGLAFEQTLVEPNMLVVDVEKFASPQAENWFSVDAKEPIAHAIVEVIEAADVKPSDLNGLADPYVKGQFGPYRFRTKTQKKTLSPKWREEFKIPICTWEAADVLTFEVRDKDHFIDDTLGDCCVTISDFRGGQRHDMWLSLQNIKMGRLHVAVTIIEENGKGTEPAGGGEELNGEYKRNPFETDAVQKGSSSSVSPEKSPRVADKFEPVDIAGQRETGIWVHQPGSAVAQVWEPRKGKGRVLDNQIHGERSEFIGNFKSSKAGSHQNNSSSEDDSLDGNRAHPKNPIRRGFRKFSSVFRRSSRNDNKSGFVEEPAPSPRSNIRALNRKDIGVKLIIDDNPAVPYSFEAPREKGEESSDESSLDSPSKGNVKGMAKSILKHAEKSAQGLKHALSRKRRSRRPKGEFGSVSTGIDISVESDSSDEESTLQQSVFTTPVESIPAISLPTSVCNEDDSLKSKENNVMTVPDSPAVGGVEDPVNKASHEDMESKGDDTSSSCEGNPDELVKDSTNFKVSERNLEVDQGK